ncbi:MAG TPA: glycosyltransferase [Acidimicrobiales bacterium]|nr:glycosyltransferase [Acidimicrobiales bacterium]
MSGIHQFVPMLHRADAVGRHTRRLRDVMVARGMTSNIYVELIDRETEAETRPYASYAADAAPGDVLVYQFATASDMAPWLQARPESLVVNYHNVTPPEFYGAWDNGMARHQLRAQLELRALAPRVELGLAVSSFNEAELRQAGYTRTAVVPPAAMVPAGAGAGAGSGAGADGAQSSPTRSSGTRWISVGRLAPNKGIEYAVMALLVARRHHDAAATLTVVGRPVVASYTSALLRFVDELGLRHAVTFTGPLSDHELVGAMAASDVFVLTSRHEGFGVPVLEAMTLGLPVVANAAGALPEIVGDAGVLVDATDPYATADAVAELVADPARRRALAEAARERLGILDLESAGDRAVDLIASLAR